MLVLEIVTVILMAEAIREWWLEARLRAAQKRGLKRAAGPRSFSWVRDVITGAAVICVLMTIALLLTQ